MPLSKLAEQRMRAAEATGALMDLPGSGAPLPADALDGLTGDALREALLLRASGAAPPEVHAIRRAADARAAVAREGVRGASASLRAELARAELEAAILLERSGRNLLARTFAAGAPIPTTEEP